MEILGDFWILGIFCCSMKIFKQSMVTRGQRVALVPRSPTALSRLGLGTEAAPGQAWGSLHPLGACTDHGPGAPSDPSAALGMLEVGKRSSAVLQAKQQSSRVVFPWNSVSQDPASPWEVGELKEPWLCSVGRKPNPSSRTLGGTGEISATGATPLPPEEPQNPARGFPSLEILEYEGFLLQAVLKGCCLKLVLFCKSWVGSGCPCPRAGCA